MEVNMQKWEYKRILASSDNTKPIKVTFNWNDLSVDDPHKNLLEMDRLQMLGQRMGLKSKV